MLSESWIGNENPGVKHAMLEVRRAFIQKVYSILTAQLLVTVAIGSYIVIEAKNRTWLVENLWLMQAASFGTLGFVIVLACCRESIRGFPVNYLCLFGLTALEGILLGFVCAVQQTQVVLLAAGLTVFIFASLTVYAFVTKSDFTGFGPYLATALMCMLGFAMVTMLMQLFGMDVKPMMMLYSAFGVVLFSMFIVYDTQLMLGEFKGHKYQYGVDDYCDAALSLYLDIINLFLDLLTLLGSNSDN